MTVIPFPTRTPVATPDDQSELLAAAHLLRVAAERPERRAEIAEAVADYLASLGRQFTKDTGQ